MLSVAACTHGTPEESTAPAAICSAEFDHVAASGLEEACDWPVRVGRLMVVLLGMRYVGLALITQTVNGGLLLGERRRGSGWVAAESHPGSISYRGKEAKWPAYHRRRGSATKPTANATDDTVPDAPRHCLHAAPVPVVAEKDPIPERSHEWRGCLCWRG